MSEADHRGPQSSAERAIDAGYQQALEARQQYISFASAVDDNTRRRLHRNLQTAVLNYFESIRYDLATASGGELNKYWNDVEMWPTGYETAPALVCVGGSADGCGFTAWTEAEYDLHAGATCPQCERSDRVEAAGFLDEREGYVPDGEGGLKRTYARGLKVLDEWYNRTQTATRERNTLLGKRTETSRSMKLLPVPILMKTARYLDEAASALGVLADTEDSHQTTVIGRDDMEAYVEKLQEFLEDDGGPQWDEAIGEKQTIGGDMT